MLPTEVEDAPIQVCDVAPRYNDGGGSVYTVVDFLLTLDLLGTREGAGWLLRREIAAGSSVRNGRLGRMSIGDFERSIHRIFSLYAV